MVFYIIHFIYFFVNLVFGFPVYFFEFICIIFAFFIFFLYVRKKQAFFIIKNKENALFVLKKSQRYDRMFVYIIPNQEILKMRRINRLFLTGCGYTVLILTMFYAFAAISKFTSQSIAPKQFALILVFGFVISAAEFMYEELKIKKAYKCIIHYCVLLVAFCFIFIVSGNISSQRPATVFIAIVLYTFLYFVIWTIVHFVRKAINSADKKLDEKTKDNDNSSRKGAYKSLYGDD